MNWSSFIASAQDYYQKYIDKDLSTDRARAWVRTIDPLALVEDPDFMSLYRKREPF